LKIAEKAATTTRNPRHRWEVNIYSNVRNTEREVIEVSELCKDGEKQQISWKMRLMICILKSKGFLDQVDIYVPNAQGS
jgi:hypothetical protein